jgi:adenylate cyclase
MPTTYIGPVVSDGFERKLVAILAADACGYSRLMATDDRATVTALDAARAVFRTNIDSQQGRVVDMAGDSVLAVFDTAKGAVNAALAIQGALTESTHGIADDRRMRFRIGIHLGDIIQKADGTVYGDGVNIAARLESIAPPGGVAISESIHLAVRGKIEACFTDRGEHTVKNISDPLRVYEVKKDGPRVPASSKTAIAADLAAARTSKPSIAVLPFTNMSGDAEQEYFADGISEDIITELVRSSQVLVTARNSTFVFKNQAVDIKDVARRFGVQHVLEGSVRKSGGRVRVTAQLTDATTGEHIWAQRFDRDLTNVFAVQDDLTENIVNELMTKLTGAALALAPPSKVAVEEYESKMRVRALQFQYSASSRDEASNDRAEVLRPRALKLVG